MQGLHRGADGVYRFRMRVGGTHRGRRLNRSFGKISFEDARKKALKLLHQYGAAARPGTRPRTVEELAEEVLALREDELAPSWSARVEGMFENHLTPFFGTTLVEDLIPADVVRYQKARLREGASNATVNREVTALYTLLNVASRLRLIAGNPIERGAAPHLHEDPPTYWFTDDEWKAFLAAFQDREAFEKAWRPRPVVLKKVLRGGRPGWSRDEAWSWFTSLEPYFRGLLELAGRLSEARLLDWKDVDLERRSVKLRQQKTSRSGVAVKLVHVSDELFEVLRKLPRGIGGAPVFARHDGKRLSREDVQKAFDLARRIARVKNAAGEGAPIRRELTVHSIRHTVGARLAMAGYHPLVIMEVLGHRSVKTTYRYLHLAPAHVREGFEAISKTRG